MVSNLKKVAKVSKGLARRREASDDLAPLARQLPPEVLSETALSRALLDIENDRSGATLALAALMNILGTDKVEFVRDDDGSLWPFVRGEKYWRGPLRKTPAGLIQMARFYPNEERIEWGSPLDTESP